MNSDLSGPGCHAVLGVKRATRSCRIGLRKSKPRVLVASAAVMVLIILGTTAWASLPFGSRQGHSYYATNAGTFQYARNQALELQRRSGLRAYLTTLNDSAEESWIRSFYPQSQWIGYSDEISEGVWRWDGPPSSFTHWLSTEPNNCGMPLAHDCQSYGQWYSYEDHCSMSHHAAVYWNDMAGNSGHWSQRGIVELEPCLVASSPTFDEFPLPNLISGCWGGSPDEEVITDDAGNRFVATCEREGPHGYFCVRYVPVDGSPSVMVSKCAWRGARVNDYYAVGPKNPETGRAYRFTGFVHLNIGANVFDDICGDTDPDCLYVDGTIQHYSVCRNILTIVHRQFPRICFGSAPARPDIVRFSGPPPSSDCAFNAFFPTDSDFSPGVPCFGYSDKSTAADSTMYRSQTEISFSGVSTGGTITLVARKAQVAITATSGQTATAVAAMLAQAVNASPEFQQIACTATSVGSTVVLDNVSEPQVAVEITDRGFYQPPLPRAVSAEMDGDALRLAWENPEPYDTVHVVRGGMVVGLFLDGAAESYLDEDASNWPPEYWVVGWKNGMPSSRAVYRGGDVSLEVEPDPIIVPAAPWVAAHVEVTLPLEPDQVDADNLVLNDTVRRDTSQAPEVGDWDHDGRPDVTVRFASAAVLATLEPGLGARVIHLRGPIGSQVFAVSDTVQIAEPTTDVQPGTTPTANQASIRPESPSTVATVHLACSIPRAGHWTVRVYSIRGELMRSIFDGEMAEGERAVSWDGRDTQGARVAGGMYLVRLEGEHEQATTKVMILK